MSGSPPSGAAHAAAPTAASCHPCGGATRAPQVVTVRFPRLGGGAPPAEAVSRAWCAACVALLEAVQTADRATVDARAAGKADALEATGALTPAAWEALAAATGQGVEELRVRAALWQFGNGPYPVPTDGGARRRRQPEGPRRG